MSTTRRRFAPPIISLTLARAQVLTREQSGRLAETEHARRRQAELGVEIDGEERGLKALRDVWSAYPADELRPEDPFAEGLVERLDAELAAVTERLERIRSDETKGRALASEISKAREVVERFRAELDQAEERFKALDGDIGRAEQTTERAAEDGKRQQTGIDDE